MERAFRNGAGHPVTILVEEIPENMKNGPPLYVDYVVAEFRKRGIRFNIVSYRVPHYRKPLGLQQYGTILWHRLWIRPPSPVHPMYLIVLPPTTKVVTIQSLTPFRMPPEDPIARQLFRMVERDLLRYPEIYVAVSNTTKRDLHELLGVSLDSIFVAPPGVDRNEFRPDAGPRPSVMRPDKINLLHVGNGFPRKGIHLLVEALGRLDTSRYRLIRAGPLPDPAYSDAYHRRAKELGVDLVECGYIDRAELPAYFANCDLLVAPSIDEDGPMPPLEAMACGTNVVLSDIPPHRERGGDLAFFFRSGDAEHLASTIENALRNRRSPDRLRTHATAYSWGLAADAYEKAYAQAGIGL